MIDSTISLLESIPRRTQSRLVHRSGRSKVVTMDCCDNTTMHLLKANDFVAKSIRKEMDKRNILLINMTSSAGSGKTSLLQETFRHLVDRPKIKVLVGDLETKKGC